MKNNVVMIIHHRIRIHRDAEAIGQLQNASLDPLAAMLVTPLAEFIPAAQEGAANASRNHVKKAGLAFGNDLAASVGHKRIVASGNRGGHQKSA